MVALAAAVALPSTPTLTPATAATALPPRAPALDGLTSYVMAMHLHASASEGVGSVRSQLSQAALNGLDVAWFTEHDWRRRRLLFRPAYHFLANESSTVGGVWNLAAMANIGSLSAASGALQVTTPTSPNDASATKASLRLRATSADAAAGTVRRRINVDRSRANVRGRITGRS
jgi:hypothetical protein